MHCVILQTNNTGQMQVQTNPIIHLSSSMEMKIINAFVNTLKNLTWQDSVWVWVQAHTLWCGCLLDDSLTHASTHHLQKQIHIKLFTPFCQLVEIVPDHPLNFLAFLLYEIQFKTNYTRLYTCHSYMLEYASTVYEMCIESYHYYKIDFLKYAIPNSWDAITLWWSSNNHPSLSMGTVWPLSKSHKDLYTPNLQHL